MAEFPRLYVPAAPEWGSDNALVRQFISCLMRRGKKATAERVFRDALNLVQKHVPFADPVDVFADAVECLKPAVEIRSQRVGGTTHHLPMPVNKTRQQSLAFRWIIHAARGQSGRPTSVRLADVILDAHRRGGQNN